MKRLGLIAIVLTFVFCIGCESIMPSGQHVTDDIPVDVNGNPIHGADTNDWHEVKQ